MKTQITDAPKGVGEALETCAAQFRYYEEQHRAKGTADATAKADTNRAMAAMCDAALAQARAATTAASPGGWDAYTQRVWADLLTVIRSSLPTDFPNYGDWPISLPAGHWRHLLAASPQPPVQPGAVTTETLVERVQSLRDEWARSTDVHWGDSISWGSALEVAKRLDAAPPVTEGT